jgi:hypothetical protein
MVPEVAETTLQGGIFASRQTMYFDLLLAGVGAAFVSRRRRWLLLALPWLGLLTKRLDAWPPGRWRHSLKITATMAALHATWLAGLVAGSLRARRPVL